MEGYLAAGAFVLLSFIWVVLPHHIKKHYKKGQREPSGWK